METKSDQKESETEADVAMSYLLPAWTNESHASSMESLMRLLDDVWSDRYLNRSLKFEERRDGKQSVLLRDWEKDAKEGEEMMDMILNIQARSWPDVR